MAQINSEVYLVGPLDLIEMLVLVYVDCNELVADFRRVLCSVDKAELFVVDSLSDDGLLVEVDVLALHAFGPSDFVEALTEENDISQNDLVEIFVDTLTCAEEVESENLIYEHIRAVLLCQVEVVTLPLGIPLDDGRGDVFQLL